MEIRKMVTITLCTRQQKRHWCIEQSYGLCLCFLICYLGCFLQRDIVLSLSFFNPPIWNAYHSILFLKDISHSCLYQKTSIFLLPSSSRLPSQADFSVSSSCSSQHIHLFYLIINMNIAIPCDQKSFIKCLI